MQQKNGILSSNVLKIIALVTMTIDHIGYLIFPEIAWLRLVGRLAFPIYAYFIAEGCKYTKNKLKYFALVCGLGIICQVVSYLFTKQTDFNILITFSFSIVLIYLLQWFKANLQNKDIKKSILSGVLFVVSLTCIFILTYEKLSFSPISVDYGFFGILLPVFVSIFDNKTIKLIFFTIGLILISLHYSLLQWFSLLSVLFMFLYNGKRGKLKLKYLFYIYYPLHLVVLYFIQVFLI